jgi:hypothetical protein
MTKPLTDEQWIKQNSHLGPDACKKRGLCWKCGGQGGNYWAFGGERGLAQCSECNGTGKATK